MSNSAIWARTATWGIPYVDVVDPTGYTERHGTSDGGEVTRTVKTSWTTSQYFKQAVLGWPELYGSQIRRSLPERHPYETQLYVSACDLVGGLGLPMQDGAGLVSFRDTIPGTGDLGSSGYAIYRLTYTARPYEIKTDAEKDANTLGELCRFVQRTRDIQAENIPIPTGYLKFTEGTQSGDRVPTTYSRTYHYEQFVYIWHDVPGVPEAGIRDIIGTVNISTFDEKYAAGTVLLMGAKVIPTWAPSSKVGIYQRTWRIEYNFGYRPQGWNYFPDSDGEFVAIVRVSTGLGPFESSAFSQLFVIA